MKNYVFVIAERDIYRLYDGMQALHGAAIMAACYDPGTNEGALLKNRLSGNPRQLLSGNGLQQTGDIADAVRAALLYDAEATAKTSFEKESPSAPTPPA